jgi:sugar phosphate isomerase/epimerase
MIPRLSVIEFTTPMLSFLEDLSIYRAAGMEGISIVEEKLLHPADDLARLKESELQVSSFFPACVSLLPSPLMPGPQLPADRIRSICRSIKRLAPFEPACCFVTTGPRGRYGWDEAHEIVIDGYRQVAAAAAVEGMVVALEVLHRSLANLFGFVNSIDDALTFLTEINEDNVMIALDVWHLEEEPNLFDDIRVNAKRFASLHVNGRRKVTRSWCDSVLPGDGVTDLSGVLASLDRGGFAGWFELEIISDDGRVEHDFPDSLWKQDPQELLITAREQFVSAWERRFAQ